MSDTPVASTVEARKRPSEVVQLAAWEREARERIAAAAVMVEVVNFILSWEIRCEMEVES